MPEPDDATTDERIAARISELVDDEHRLREHDTTGGASDEDRRRLAAIEVELDQCWDLLRQRRARHHAHQPDDDTAVRPAPVVEGYQQ